MRSVHKISLLLNIVRGISQLILLGQHAHLASHSLHEQCLQDEPASLQVRQENKIATEVKNVVTNAEYKMLVLFRSIIM